MTTTTKKKAVRRRSVAATSPEEQPEVIRARLMREFLEANAAANAASKIADTKRKELFVMMEKEGIAEFSTPIVLKGSTVQAEAIIATPTREVIDVIELKRLTDEAQFMAAISATKTSVTDVCGKDIATRCAVAVKGTRNVNIKVKK